MTNIIDPANISAEIDALRADLLKVTEAIPVIGSAAVAKAKEIAAAIEEAQDRFTDAMADQYLAARKARLDQFTDIAVDTIYPNNYEGNLLRANFVIRYSKLEYDCSYRIAVPKAHSCAGFAALPDAAYEYLIHEKPEAIPAEIMALAPGEPHEAFGLYFQAKRRGCIRTAARPADMNSLLAA